MGLLLQRRTPRAERGAFLIHFSYFSFRLIFSSAFRSVSRHLVCASKYIAFSDFNSYVKRTFAISMLDVDEFCRNFALFEFKNIFIIHSENGQTWRCAEMFCKMYPNVA